MLTYSCQQLFTGTKWLYNVQLKVRNGMVQAIEPCKKPANAYIIPSYIDNQIYGAGGKLFSVFQNVQCLQVLQQHCAKNGTQFFMPTVATNTYEVLFNCIDAIKTYWQQGGKGCLGLHVEGPWINAEKRGAHVHHLVHAPTMQQVKKLLAYGKGVIKIITLAPECIDDKVLAYLQQQKIVLSIGHSNASYKQATHFLNNGIPTCTHLFNAMSSFNHREPNLVGAILNHPTATSSIIPDGLHVSFEALQLAKKMMGKRLYAITDAVTNTSEGHYQHELKSNYYSSNGILSGSALTMHQAMLNLVQYGNIPLSESIKMCTIYPAKVLGLHKQIGIVKKGLQLAATALNEQLNIEAIL
jgi:N-acetylglucosamine-6-phosphate deacetylase